MRTMAGVWFSVIVLVSMQKVFGDVCQPDKKIEDFTCDECIRCGADWCNKPEPEESHCSLAITDGWCNNDREYPVEKEEKDRFDTNPFYAERMLMIGQPSKIDIRYTATSKNKPDILIVNTTQTFNIELKQYGHKCSGANCLVTIEAKALSEFCSASGGVTESVEVKISMEAKEEAHIKYYVACACACSLIVETDSPVCNKNGNLSCGVCSCKPGWRGKNCELPESPKVPECDGSRGDINQCSLSSKTDEDCSFNGYCGPCETCICYTDREGSQYFDQTNNCAGLCSVAAEFEDCLVNNTIGKCSMDNRQMTIQRYNETLTAERDNKNRKVWVKCNETIDSCGLLEFYAKRDENDMIFVMMLNHCNEISAAAVVADTKVPIILGVLGIVAAVAAVSGVMLWKHMNTVPPVPLNDPQYQNIDAEDCTGENPLYKPPTSSFKNPTYGKW
ncbi:hypothetical protein PYW07_000859 [Mythimna separata]|uniref:Integrin beta epidermal growth factor-like domain-containing protein n=1 Tax=Mythimna separata TaxID=271217 RepID=A0AAD8DVB6_MYTSE|nr:hypothetical protein PYW07_000859 [Mythimna separata]